MADQDRRLAGLAFRVMVLRAVTAVASVLVGVIAGVQSYSHMHDLAVTAGEGWRAHLFPISVDGVVVTASMVLLTQQMMILLGRVVPLWHRLFAGGALAASVSVSLAANIADAANRSDLARALAGWPALAFATVFELVLIQWRISAEQPEPATVSPAVESPGAPPIVPAPTFPAVAPVRSQQVNTPLGSPLQQRVRESTRTLHPAGDPQPVAPVTGPVVEPESVELPPAEIPVGVLEVRQQLEPTVTLRDELLEPGPDVAGDEVAKVLDEAEPLTHEQRVAALRAWVSETQVAGRRAPSKRQIMARFNLSDHHARTLKALVEGELVTSGAPAGNGQVPGSDVSSDDA